MSACSTYDFVAPAPSDPETSIDVAPAANVMRVGVGWAGGFVGEAVGACVAFLVGEAVAAAVALIVGEAVAAATVLVAVAVATCVAVAVAVAGAGVAVAMYVAAAAAVGSGMVGVVELHAAASGNITTNKQAKSREARAKCSFFISLPSFDELCAICEAGTRCAYCRPFWYRDVGSA